MKRKTIIILLALTIVLFSISSVCASDADDIAVSNAKITINLNGKSTPVTTDNNGQRN